MTVCNWGPQEAMINVGNIGRGLVGLSCQSPAACILCRAILTPRTGRRSRNRSITVA